MTLGYSDFVYARETTAMAQDLRLAALSGIVERAAIIQARIQARDGLAAKAGVRPPQATAGIVEQAARIEARIETRVALAAKVSAIFRAVTAVTPSVLKGPRPVRPPQATAQTEDLVSPLLAQTDKAAATPQTEPSVPAGVFPNKRHAETKNEVKVGQPPPKKARAATMPKHPAAPMSKVAASSAAQGVKCAVAFFQPAEAPPGRKQLDLKTSDLEVGGVFAARPWWQESPRVRNEQELQEDAKDVDWAAEQERQVAWADKDGWAEQSPSAPQSRQSEWFSNDDSAAGWAWRNPWDKHHQGRDQRPQLDPQHMPEWQMLSEHQRLSGAKRYCGSCRTNSYNIRQAYPNPDNPQLLSFGWPPGSTPCSNPQCSRGPKGKGKGKTIGEKGKGRGNTQRNPGRVFAKGNGRVTPDGTSKDHGQGRPTHVTSKSTGKGKSAKPEATGKNHGQGCAE